MVYEKRLDTLEDLADELRILDFDGGVRIQGRFGGEPCFIFITRASDDFTVVLYSEKKGESGTNVPDRKLMMKEYSEIAPLMKFLEGEALDPLEAYSY